MKKNQGIDPRIQEFLSALASETRLNLLLSFADGKEKTVGELVELSGLGQSTISTHLSQLKKRRNFNSQKIRERSILQARSRTDLGTYFQIDILSSKLLLIFASIISLILDI
ncbi:ArsR/SmtB family transcription factor [Leptospira ellisii]|uniref:ArsR/SmtB family transcription factor n=1 Tax=Leptospira ellisii TaxID=2023197 RepID=UPI000C2A46B5|nr:hypothetical protein CH375_13495 [Leptospira ellisii]